MYLHTANLVVLALLLRFGLSLQQLHVLQVLLQCIGFGLRLLSGFLEVRASVLQIFHSLLYFLENAFDSLVLYVLQPELLCFLLTASCFSKSLFWELSLAMDPSA